MRLNNPDSRMRYEKREERLNGCLENKIHRACRLSAGIKDLVNKSLTKDTNTCEIEIRYMNKKLNKMDLGTIQKIKKNECMNEKEEKVDLEKIRKKKKKSK